MADKVKSESVPANVFINAVCVGRKAGKSNKEIAASLKMKIGTFNVRLTQLKAKVKETPNGEALLARLGGAKRMPRVDAVGLLQSALDEVGLDCTVDSNGRVEEFDENGTLIAATENGEKVEVAA